MSTDTMLTWTIPEEWRFTPKQQAILRELLAAGATVAEAIR